ncbi:sulfotransferase domain-containing protein [Thermodesulfobacteriota bacterium]
MKPNFLIVGAAKSGTTSLHDYLRQHPDIFLPEWKEPSFFIADPAGIVHRTGTLFSYLQLFKNSENHTAIGEASTGYLYDEGAPKGIKKALGSIKILIVLRDPVEMSYSLYNHQVRKEGETLKTFEEALAVEHDRFKDPAFKQKCYGWHANFYYYHRGLYYEQVKRYLETFDSSNILIIRFKDIVAEPIRVVRKIFGFLGAEPTFEPVIKVLNPAGEILNIPRFWEDTGNFRKTVSFVFSGNIFRKVPHLIRSIGLKPPQPINAETERALRKRFYDDICRLEKLIDRDLSAWKLN